MDDVRSWWGLPWVGSCETAVGPWWRLVPPEVRVVVVRRPVGEVVEGLVRAGAPESREDLTRLVRRLDAKLQQVERRRPGVVAVGFAELATEAGCTRVFEHCLGLPHDTEWWRVWQGVNIQVSVVGTLAYIRGYLPQLARMAAEAKGAIWRELTAQRGARRSGPLRVGVEPFEKFALEGGDAFRAHVGLVGKDWSVAQALNWRLGAAMAARGELFVVTAREGSRVVGYAVVMLGGDLMSSRVVASLVFLFALPEYRLLGVRLAREAFREARRVGADTGWLFRTGDSTFSGRLGVLAKRLGAKELSTTYELSLAGAAPHGAL